VKIICDFFCTTYVTQQGLGGISTFRCHTAAYFKHTNENLKKILNFIKVVSPDITGLLEVDSGSFRSQKTTRLKP